MYEFVRGPLVWVAFVVFFGGCLYRLVSTLRLAKKDKVVYAYMSPRYGLRSILHWIVPFASRNSRMRPLFTILSFVFHVCLLATPVFLLGHMVLWRHSWGFGWWTLPEKVGTVMTFLVVAIGIVFALRRIVDPVVRYVTSASDYILLAVVIAPFVTGLLAYYHAFDYTTAITLHIVSGAVWLMAIPFTRLVHMIFFPFTRAYMGSEFGFVRNSKDW